MPYSLRPLEPFDIQVGLADDTVSARLFCGVEAHIGDLDQSFCGLARLPMCNADREGDAPEVFASRPLDDFPRGNGLMKALGHGSGLEKILCSEE